MYFYYSIILNYIIHEKNQFFRTILSDNSFGQFFRTILVFLAISTLFESCQTLPEDATEQSMIFKPTLNQDQIEVVYEREGGFSTHTLYQKNITKVERIGNNTLEGLEVISNVKKLNNVRVDLTDIKRITFDHSDVRLLSLSLEDNKEKSLILYQKGKNVKFAFASLINSNGLKHFQLTDVEGNLLFSVDINAQDKLGNFNFGQGNINKSAIIREDFPVKKNGSCVSTTDNFGDCMQCGLSECGRDWICTATLAVAPHYVLAGFALGCAFA